MNNIIKDKKKHKTHRVIKNAMMTTMASKTAMVTPTSTSLPLEDSDGVISVVDTKKSKL